MTGVPTKNQDLWGQEEIRFSDFMKEALYGNQGYYTQFVQIGGGGADFYTAALSPLFSFTVARYVVAKWEEFGQPHEFQVVELGAGQGELAQGICRWLSSYKPEIRLRYVIVEVSGHLLESQQRRLRHELACNSGGIQVHWGEPDATLPTALIANEVLDALPVERLRRTRGGWEQAFVQRQEDRFQWVWKPAPQELTKLGEAYLGCPVGTTAEICNGYQEFFAEVSRYGKPLDAIFFDYGISKSEWAAGVRPEGTLRGFHQHQVVDVLETPGLIDLTADVNWDYASASAAKAGFAVQPLLTQGQFLMQFGILDVLQSLQEQLNEIKHVQKRAELIGQFKQLVYPGGMGERFSVLSIRRN